MIIITIIITIIIIIRIIMFIDDAPGTLRAVTRPETQQRIIR